MTSPHCAAHPFCQILFLKRSAVLEKANEQLYPKKIVWPIIHDILQIMVIWTHKNHHFLGRFRWSPMCVCVCVSRSRKCRSWDLSTFPSAFGQENLEKTEWNHGIWNLQNLTPRGLNIQVYDRLIVVNLSKRDNNGLWLSPQSHQVCHKNACDYTPFWATYQSAWYCFITLGIAFQVFL